MNNQTNEQIVQNLPEYAKLAPLITAFFQSAIKEHGQPQGKYEGMDAEDLFHTWMVTENTALGGMQPLTLILMGRGHKVVKFVKTALAENRR